MKLRTRFLLFSQGMLALVLIGFSASLYLLASKHLRGQADERLESALNTLAAAAEINELGVEWEPGERSLSFGRRAVEGGFLWRVSDEQGRPIDGPGIGPSDRVLDRPATASITPRRPVSVTDPSGRPWRVLHRLLESPTPRGQTAPAEGQPPGDGRFFQSLQLSAAVSLEPMRDTLHRLGLVLGGLSAALWSAALVLGGRMGRRALRPLTTMANAAHAIGGDHPDRRLPLPDTDDELEDLGRSFNALLDRLQESFERQQRFTGDASHQLRTPLTAIQGQVDLALRQERDPGEYRRVLALVQKRTRHLRQIVETLLFLARADSEAFRPKLVAIDLASWLPDHMRSHPNSSRQPDLKLAGTDLAPLMALAHPGLLGELVDNLLDNAARYSQPGTPIEIRIGRDGGGAALVVQDHGMGIAEADLPHLFEPFFRAPAVRDSASAAAGSGLGLSVALRLARLFDATISVASRPGHGSTFTVRFPKVDHASG